MTDTENEAVAKALGKGLPDHERPVFWGAALHDRQADEVARAAIAALDAHRASQAMTDPYTPTMDDFRRESVNRVPMNRRDEQRAMWDAVLAQHDAELRQQVAREFLEIMDRPTTWSEETRLPKLLRLFDALRAHAAHLAEQGSTTDREVPSQ